MTNDQSSIKDWLPHDKAGVPDVPCTQMEVVMRSSRRAVGAPQSFDWSIRGVGDDIIFYRVWQP